ncbi:hypothetical protein RFI_25495, partial [Reticulomyxa filosa]
RKRIQIKNNMATSSPFESMHRLPENFPKTQCVALARELLIFGGRRQVNCYSYHIRGNQYRFLSSFPSNYTTWGYCVVKIPKANDQKDTTLWIFGGYDGKVSIIKYASVWKKKAGIQWLSQVNSTNTKPIYIQCNQRDYCGVRAVVGGRNNNLLFVTYSKSIDVFNMSTCKYVSKFSLPIVDTLNYHCLVLKTAMPSTAAAERLQKKIKTEMLLFCQKTGLSIDYDEYQNKFDVANVHMCSTMRTLSHYAFLCTSGMVLFFGGIDGLRLSSANVHKYMIEENKWVMCTLALPHSLADCAAVVCGGHENVHVMGGLTHIKAELKYWMKCDTQNEKLWITEEQGLREMEEVNREMSAMPNVDINNLK